ncbi:MAG: SIS domain-containing protein [bacterium]|nr:SIS domain-containing protein [bacterium]
MEPEALNSSADQLNSILESSIRDSAEMQLRIIDLIPQLKSVAALFCQAWEQNHTVYVIGNGGSAAEAQHLTAELVGRFERDNCLAAHALTTDTSIITALSNDFSFDQVYERQVRALVKKGDVVVAISTSGNSSSIVRAAKQALSSGASVIGLSGASGGQLNELCHICLKVPSTRTCRIQEAHLTIIHLLCELVELMHSS